MIPAVGERLSSMARLSVRGGDIARPILRLATRLTPRTRTTALAIAFATMVLVGSLSLLGGLREGSDATLARLEPGPSVYVRGPDFLASRIEPLPLFERIPEFDILRIHVGRLEINGLDAEIVVAAASHVSEGVEAADYPFGLDDVSLDAGLRDAIAEASGRSVDATGTLVLLGRRLADLPIVDPPPERPKFLPDDWAYVRPEFLAAIDATEGGSVQAIVVDDPLDAAVVSELGLTRLETVGAAAFFRGSLADAEAALGGLALVIAAVIGLLVYFAISLEVAQRTAEIRALRSVGASPATVAAVYEGQALTLAALGAGLGIALGIVLAHAVVSFASLFGLPNLVILAPPVDAALRAVGLAVLASAAAAAVPARRAALIARRAPEAIPS